MAYKRGWRAVAYAVLLVGCGAAANAAWQNRLWGSLAGATLVALWLTVLNWWFAWRRAPTPPTESMTSHDLAADRILLDAAPTPMVIIEGPHARALNRAARLLFGTDDRLLPVPVALIRGDTHLRHEGRQWRIDRVILNGMATPRSVAALVDVEQEQRVAEARATAEMIHVLGHELLNGLAPFLSLAESGESALSQPNPDPRLLREILGTLGRHAEGLQRFTAGYRKLARLPAPRLSPVSPRHMVDDLSRLFCGRWPEVALHVKVDNSQEWLLDRDQLHQALWSLLQNAAEAAAANEGVNATVNLTISLTEASLFIEVQDNGSGITPDDATRVFRPFYTTKPNGTGIGLSLARQIALAHGGSLSLIPSKITTFLFTIPRINA